MTPPKLHPQHMKYCLNCIENRGEARIKHNVIYGRDDGTRGQVKLCELCDVPGVTTIYDLDPYGMMP